MKAIASPLLEVGKGKLPRTKLLFVFAAHVDQK